mmetsp:Transcript_40250/g.78685  ORF Transcript_40250/g.78685 Transcript_40250/m.78685 type:complete len:178 (-) Transcript_40250:3850-4383(-)
MRRLSCIMSRRQQDRSPHPLPTEFWSFLHMVDNHVRIVGVATNNLDSHLVEVIQIRSIMEAKCNEKKSYTPEMLAHIFWHILMDSWQYFNTFVGTPQSNLDVLRESIRSFWVPAPMNCPLQKLMDYAKKRERDENELRGGEEDRQKRRRFDNGEGKKAERIVPGWGCFSQWENSAES